MFFCCFNLQLYNVLYLRLPLLNKKIFFFVGGVLVWVGCVGVLKGHFTLIELCSLWFCSRLLSGAFLVRCFETLAAQSDPFLQPPSWQPTLYPSRASLGSSRTLLMKRRSTLSLQLL